MAAIGDMVLVHNGNGDVAPAVVELVHGDGSVDVLYGAGSGWGSKQNLTVVANASLLDSSTYTPIVDDDSGFATSSAVSTAIAGCCATPGTGSDPGLSGNTPRQASATRPTLVTISGSWSWTLNATGTVTASVILKSDASSTPTTARHTAAFSRGITVGLSVGDSGTVPFCVTYPVPAGHYYTVATTGSGLSFAIQETTL